MRIEIARHGRGRVEDGRGRVSFNRSAEGKMMPRKIRELIADLENAGFENRGGKGSHRNFAHPKVTGIVTISGQLGDDAKR
ncbi:MAG: type II toxin-antitoxin system HicA family toxin [Pirellula sp.]|nr:type II toxin-antitoxin system HicA family toxin [Pirellula sp.]